LRQLDYHVIQSNLTPTNPLSHPPCFPNAREPRYIQAVAQVTNAYLADKGDIDRFVLSYHGIPIKYHERSDPYPWHCEATTAALVAAMGWDEGQYIQTCVAAHHPRPIHCRAHDHTAAGSCWWLVLVARAVGSCC